MNRPRLQAWVRVALVLTALGLVGLFGIAIHLNPYRDGHVWRGATHTQLGLPPCTFQLATHLPCPSCGMSTSFALLIRGDVWNSMQANWVGTLLALFCLLLIPWGLVSAWRGRSLWIRSLEYTFARLVVGFMLLMILRWLVVLAWIWWEGLPPGAFG